MKRIALALALCAPLAACNQNSHFQSYAALSAEALYTAASNTGEGLVRSNAMDKERFKELDRKAFAMLQAYRAGNATLDELKAALKPMEGN